MTETQTPTLTDVPTATNAVTQTVTEIIEPLTLALYWYDGQGNLPHPNPPQMKTSFGEGESAEVNGITTLYVGVNYVVEIDDSEETTQKYYAFGSMRVAMRTIAGETNTLQWMLSDHLGSTSIVTNADGSYFSELRYSAFGEIRFSYNITPTGYRYTGQLAQAEIGLYYYGARWYDPNLGRFVQADTIVPGAGNPMAWDRYAYVLNNPIRLVDPSGHVPFHRDSWVDGEGAPNSEHVRNNDDFKFVLPPNANNEETPGIMIDRLFWDLVNGGLDIGTTLEAREYLFYTSKGNNIILYGPRWARSTLGMRAYTNRIGAGNLNQLFSQGVRNGVLRTTSSPALPLSLIFNGLMDYSSLQNGDFDRYDFGAAVLFDTGNTITSSIISFTIAGAVAGGLASGGSLAIPGGVIGAVVGVGVGFSISWGLDTYIRDWYINTVAEYWRPN